MERYFFDVVGQQHSEYDYRGQVFPTREKAYQLAELIALDIAVKDEDRSAGFTINVRKADGCDLFSVPVQSSCIAAA